MKPKFLFLFLVLCSLTIDNVLATSLGTHGKIPDNETIYRVSKQRCWGCIGESLEFLFTHNLVRATKWEPLLFWDFQLEKYARWWALQRKADCKLQHSFPEGDFKLGENIYWGSGSAWRPGDAVSAWSEEEKYYDYATNSCQEGQMCGHYTQIVWKNTRRIGCARVVCDTGDVFMTCNYDPPGNYIGERPY
ncbi:hypothetical protein ERO13_D08G095500v2 [Gossypium hirsutum]|uniref:Pathogenesis-related protein PR-1 n=4 Tax=Gossypium TaxID=3633 RepID=A0A1U8JPM5_GOSHI|nr:pathogenesis-related protein PR-1-like [Gossypium hirsutum]KAB2016509.1 hypothetical protein ES319_D08G101600v1 [Gossypium barbadense]KAG4133418.1 hypothetical protein ERO13_D08G095500v2 [Gossypium hirsutum]TYG56987.1 hypothetical protein ES288_D08G107500v1 [Gossypium darwinii]TYH57679.1 hypothetical protein ES332_D08G106200v1 [Gossypium tomentosum]